MRGKPVVRVPVGRYQVCFWVERGSGDVNLRRRSRAMTYELANGQVRFECVEITGENSWTMRWTSLSRSGDELRYREQGGAITSTLRECKTIFENIRLVSTHFIHFTFPILV